VPRSRPVFRYSWLTACDRDLPPNLARFWHSADGSGSVCTCRWPGLTLRMRAYLARLVIPSPSAHPPGAARAGSMVPGWPGFHPSHHTTSTVWRRPSWIPRSPPEASGFAILRGSGSFDL
jgi:hypothetical protein